MRKLLMIPAFSAAAMLAACDSTALENVLNGICTGLSAGATAAAVIAPLTGNGGAITISQILSNVATDCPAFSQDVADEVSKITSLGGSAQVSMSAENVSPSVSRALKRKYGVGDNLKAVFVVDPSGNVTRK